MNPLMFVSATVIGSFSAYLAHKRGRNPYLWFSVGFLFGIFGIFAIFFATRQKEKTLKNPVKKEPVYTISGPRDKMWYYLDAQHTQQGPMSHDALLKALKETKINETTHVWNEEMTDWQRLKEILTI